MATWIRRCGSLTEKVTLSKDLKEERKGAWQMSDGKAFQVEGPAGAKALRWDLCLTV